MKVRVLGCHGGELPGCRTTCFLIDGRTALDAGALTGTLPLPELLALEDIFLSHAHFDHVRDVPLLTDLRTESDGEPLRIHGPRGCLDTLARSVFNDELWPDFTRIPSPEKPVLRLLPVVPGEPVAAGSLVFTPMQARHPVDTVGYLVRDGEACIAFSGDTGPGHAMWEDVAAVPGLRAVFCEVSFPNRLQWLAGIAGHLTPALLAGEVAKLRRDVPVFLYHLKPAYLDELHRELAALGDRRLRVLELDEEFDFR